MPASVAAADRALVDEQSRVGDARARVEAGDDLFDARHLGRVLGADERADDDSLQAGVGERVDQANLVLDADRRALDLHALAHALFVEHDFRIRHRSTPHAAADSPILSP
jgi:hypothetical protein